MQKLFLSYNRYILYYFSVLKKITIYDFTVILIVYTIHNLHSSSEHPIIIDQYHDRHYNILCISIILIFINIKIDLPIMTIYWITTHAHLFNKPHARSVQSQLCMYTADRCILFYMLLHEVNLRRRRVPNVYYFWQPTKRVFWFWFSVCVCSFSLIPSIPAI